MPPKRGAMMMCRGGSPGARRALYTEGTAFPPLDSVSIGPAPARVPGGSEAESAVPPGDKMDERSGHRITLIRDRFPYGKGQTDWSFKRLLLRSLDSETVPPPRPHQTTGSQPWAWELCKFL